MLYSPGVRPPSSNEPSDCAFTVCTYAFGVLTALISAPRNPAHPSLVTLPRIVAVVVWAPAETATAQAINTSVMNCSSRLMNRLLFFGHDASLAVARWSGHWFEQESG